jgi:hypothetical protein
MTDEEGSRKSTKRSRQRFAARIPGDRWEAQVRGIPTPVRVVRLSRTGIELETDKALDIGARYAIRLGHGGKTTDTTFYVLRCPEEKNGAKRTYRPAGLFVETLDRADLPAVIPDAPSE